MEIPTANNMPFLTRFSFLGFSARRGEKSAFIAWFHAFSEKLCARDSVSIVKEFVK